MTLSLCNTQPTKPRTYGERSISMGTCRRVPVVTKVLGRGGASVRALRSGYGGALRGRDPAGGPHAGRRIDGECFSAAYYYLTLQSLYFNCHINHFSYSRIFY